MASNNGKDKSLESWIWDAACSIRGAKDAPKYKDYILPLIFTKRLCDVFDDELNRIAKEVGSRKKAFQLAKADHKLVRFYLPLLPDDPEQPVWSVIRKLSDRIGEGVTTHMRAIARELGVDCIQEWSRIIALRLAVLFHRSRSNLDLPPMQLQKTGKGFLFRISHDWLEHNPLTATALNQECTFWDGIGLPLELQDETPAR